MSGVILHFSPLSDQADDRSGEDIIVQKRRWDDEVDGGSDTLMLTFGIGVNRLEAEHFFAA